MRGTLEAFNNSRSSTAKEKEEKKGETLLWALSNPFTSKVYRQVRIVARKRQKD